MVRFLTALAATIAMTGAMATADVRLQGAGSTFVAPAMQRWVAEYQKIHPDVQIDYQSIGSGGGVKSFIDKTADFGASDAPLGKMDLDAAGGADNVIEFPVIAGGVVPAYNLPGVQQTLNISGQVLARIFLGTITKWNDPAIAAINPGVTLPDLAITPAWRTDGSGTTFIFTNYLSSQSDDFDGTIGAGKQVKWPVGTGGKGNEGVTAAVQQTAGGIGYIELAYAMENHITFANVQNKAGKFVTCTPDSISAASSAVAGQLKPGNLLTAGLWNQDGDDVYPIAGFTYVFIYKDLNNVKSQPQAAALSDFLTWATHDGQKMAADLHYAALSDKLQSMISDSLGTANYKGQPLH